MKLCPLPVWEDLVRKDPTATFFQTPAWHGLASDFEGTRTLPLSFDLDDGRFAVLPLQERDGRWGRRLASPFGTYATFLSASELRDDDRARLRAALAALNVDVPGSPFADRLPASPPFFRSTPSSTRVLRPQGLEPEAWVASWSRNHRRSLKAAREAGFRVRLAADARDVSRYAELYRGQVERWGSAARRSYPGELFQEAFKRFAPGGAMRLWLAESQGRVVAGRMCLYHGSHAVEWHAAAEREALDMGAGHLLVHDIVTDARARGAAIYDFNPNPGLDAVDHFKRGFATEVLEFSGFRNRTGLAGLASALASLRGRFR